MERPDPVVLLDPGPVNLLASSEPLATLSEGEDLTAEQETCLWVQAEPLFERLKQSSEEKAMWIPDLRPHAGLTAVAVIATAALAPSAQAADNYAMGICRTANESFGVAIRPRYAGDMYLIDYHNDDPRYKNFSFDSDGSRVTLVKAPRHGKVIAEKGHGANATDYQYKANAGYLGRDRFVMELERNGVKVRLHYLIEVIGDGEPRTIIGNDGERHSLWCNPESWKISSNTLPLDTVAIQTLLSMINAAPTIAVSANDLTGSSIGQTTATTITLDDNAAGYGWYIDPTPDQNEEYAGVKFEVQH